VNIKYNLHTVFVDYITSSQQWQFFSILVVVRDDDEYEYVDGPRLTPLGGCSVSCGGGTQLISCTGTVRECKLCNYIFKSLCMLQRRFFGWWSHSPFRGFSLFCTMLHHSSLFPKCNKSDSEMTLISIKKCQLPNVTSLPFQNLFAA